MQKKSIFWIVIIVGFLQGLLWAATHIALPDQMQLLEKGIRLALYGKWTHFGNLVTGGGSNPGSLTTALVGLPLMVWESPWSYELVLSGLHLAGLFLFYKALKDQMSELERFGFVCLVWLTPWRASNTFLWNPSYLFFISALHFYTAVEMNERKSFWMTFWHMLSIGIALQIHQSFIVLIFTSGYLFLRKQIKLNWFAVVTSSVLCVLSMIPYFLALRSNQNLAPVLDGADKQFFYFRGLVEVYPLLKGLIYWFRFSSALFPSYIFNAVDFDWVQNPTLRFISTYLFLIVRYVVGGLTLILSVAAFVWWALQLKKSPRYLMPTFLDNFLVASLISAFLASAITPIVFSNWHLMLIMPMTYMNLTKFIFTKPKALKVVCALSVYFVIYNIVGLLASQNQSFYINIHQRYSELRASVSH